MHETQVFEYRSLNLSQLHSTMGGENHLFSQQPAKYQSLAAKVLVQMATKMKVAPWVMKIRPKKMMVVGFDTCQGKKERVTCQIATVYKCRLYVELALNPSQSLGINLVTLCISVIGVLINHFTLFINMLYNNAIGAGNLYILVKT